VRYSDVQFPDLIRARSTRRLEVRIPALRLVHADLPQSRIKPANNIRMLPQARRESKQPRHREDTGT